MVTIKKYLGTRCELYHLKMHMALFFGRECTQYYFPFIHTVLFSLNACETV